MTVHDEGLAGPGLADVVHRAHGEDVGAAPRQGHHRRGRLRRRDLDPVALDPVRRQRVHRDRRVPVQLDLGVHHPALGALQPGGRGQCHPEGVAAARGGPGPVGAVRSVDPVGELAAEGLSRQLGHPAVRLRVRQHDLGRLVDVVDAPADADHLQGGVVPGPHRHRVGPQVVLGVLQLAQGPQQRADRVAVVQGEVVDVPARGRHLDVGGEDQAELPEITRAREVDAGLLPAVAHPGPGLAGGVAVDRRDAEDVGAVGPLDPARVPQLEVPPLVPAQERLGHGDQVPDRQGQGLDAVVAVEAVEVGGPGHRPGEALARAALDQPPLPGPRLATTSAPSSASRSQRSMTSAADATTIQAHRTLMTRRRPARSGRRSRPQPAVARRRPPPEAPPGAASRSPAACPRRVPRACPSGGGP